MRYSELIEDLGDVSDEELFGQPNRKLSSPEQAIMKFRLHYSEIRRVPDGDHQVSDALKRMFNLAIDRKFGAGENLGHAGWSVNGYTNSGEPVGVLVYWDSGGGTWSYIGTRSKEDLEEVLHMLYDINVLESPEAKRERIAAARQRKLDLAARKGIRVGSRIRMPWGNGEVIGTVTGISPAGKISIHYEHPDLPNATYTTTAGAIRKVDVIKEGNEPSDDELFGSNSTSLGISSTDCYSIAKLLRELRQHLESSNEFDDIRDDPAEYPLVLRDFNRAANAFFKCDPVSGLAALQTMAIIYDLDDWAMNQIAKKTGVKLWDIVDIDDPNIHDAFDRAQQEMRSAHNRWDGLLAESEPSDEELFGHQKDLRYVNMSTVEIDGIDTSDYPDFTDAHVYYAEWKNGIQLTDQELEWLTDEMASSGDLHDLIWDSLHETTELQTCATTN